MTRDEKNTGMLKLRDEYEILSELGAGGMATVYKAIQKSLDRPVAIKELKKSYHTDLQIVQRFEREAKMSASFQHENIVHIYDYWKKPDYCIVMEYVDGTNLAEVIEKTGSLPVDVGVMIAIQVLSALDYAHMRGLIHRDIKPSNIMIKKNGEVKLMDFGIAHTKALQTLTQPGTFLGTPAYMSPEQILGQGLDVQSDIFSFGIVLYEMFTGAKPFEDEENRSVTAKILKDKPIPPRRLNKDIPRGLQRIIKKCMQKKLERRYASVSDLAKALGKNIAGKTNKSASLRRISDYLVACGVFEAPTEEETVVITKVSGSGVFKKIILAAGVTLLASIAAAAWYLWGREDMHPAPLQPLEQLPAVPTDISAPPSATKPFPPAVPAPEEKAAPPPQERHSTGSEEPNKRVKKKKTSRKEGHHTQTTPRR